MPIDHVKSDCDQQLLRGYLDQELTADQEAELEAHLDQCLHCRERIRESAAEEHWWAAAGNYLKRDDVNELAESGMIRSRRAATAESDVSHHVVLRQIRDWLDPADDPKYIGRFGGYEIVGVVGCGGMGVVLKGFEPPLNRYVAIKVLSPALAASGAARQRFAREAQAAAAVLHENVIAIHRVDQAHGLPYLVMPFVGGVSLQRRIDDEGPLPLAAILRIGRQIATGLAAAHSQGLVHRDIKPANILLDRGVERVTITDFGLARAADDGSLTKTGVIAGTPQYMSPEQSRGNTIDARSDLFSLGSVLYAMCTGHPPFRAETGYGILRRITDTEPRPVREINPEIPEWFEAIIRRLHAKNPDERFQTAEELAELLEECLAHVQQPTVVPLPDRISIPKQCEISTDRTKKLRKGVFAMIATVAVGLLGLSLWQSTDPPDVSGNWTGEDWGQVVLKETQSGRYEGTYTRGLGEEGGQIDLKWSRLERRFNGTWREGGDRQGKISLRLVDDQLRGAWTTSNKWRANPGTPKLADLLWTRRIESAPALAAEFVPKKAAVAAADQLAGVWKLESWTDNEKERDGVAGTLTFRGNQVRILINPGSDEDVQKRPFRYFSVNPEKSPAEINLYDTNFLMQGIYKLEGDKLTLAAFSRSEVGRPRGFTVAEAKPDRETTGALGVMTFRRVDLDIRSLGGSLTKPDQHESPSNAAASASFDITGVVLSDQKTPLADADVLLLETYIHAEKLHAKTRTDREGKFTLKGVPQGKEKERLWRYTLVISASSFASRVVFVPYAQKEPIHFELELSAPAALRGQVVDADGSPVAGAMVWAPPLKQFIGGVHSATTDASGHFQIADLAPWNSAAEEVARKADGDKGWSGGKQVLRVHHPDYGRMVADYAQVPTTLLIRFERPMRVSGRVFDRQSGFPVAGATVRAGTVAGTSDAEGRYQLIVQPLEDLSVQAEKGAAKSQSIALKGMAASAVTLSDLYLRSPQPRREGDSKVKSDVPYQRQLLLSGTVRTDFPERPVWLGVGMHGKPREVSIVRVHPGTGAEEAGLRAGDRILALDGRTVTEIQDVVDRTIWRNPGEAATLLILRGKERLTVRVKLTEFQSSQGNRRPDLNIRSSEPRGEERPQADADAGGVKRPPAEPELGSLEGVWKVSNIKRGRVERRAELNYDFYRWRFDTKTMSVTTEWRRDGLTGGGNRFRFTIDTKETPHHMTIYGNNMLIQAIFELEGDELRIAGFGISQQGRPESFSDDRQDLGALTVYVLKKAPAAPRTGDLDRAESAATSETWATDDLDGRRSASTAARLVTPDQPQQAAAASPRPDDIPQVPIGRPAQAAEDLTALQGVWAMVSQEMGEASRTGSLPAQLTVDDERLRVRWTNGRTTSGKLVLDTSAHPRQFAFDWLIPLPGIYELEGDRLTLCFNPFGTDAADGLPTDFAVKPDASRTLCVFERINLKYRQANGEFSSPLHPTKDSPIEAKLVAEEDQYVFNARLAKELERFLDENKPKSGGGYASSGTPPPPPAVDLQLELKNVSDVPIRMVFDDEHQSSGFELEMTGPGAVRQVYGYLGPSYGSDTNRREIVIAPGDTHRIPLTRLMGVCFPPSLTKQSDRFQRSHQAFYWTAPGRYSVSGRFWASVRQDASSDDSSPGFSGVVLAEASPVTLDVVQPEPAATSEVSEGETPPAVTKPAASVQRE